jgi:hypothetical protein
MFQSPQQSVVRLVPFDPFSRTRLEDGLKTFTVISPIEFDSHPVLLLLVSRSFAQTSPNDTNLLGVAQVLEIILIVDS